MSRSHGGMSNRTRPVGTGRRFGLKNYTVQWNASRGLRGLGDDNFGFSAPQLTPQPDIITGLTPPDFGSMNSINPAPAQSNTPPPSDAVPWPPISAPFLSAPDPGTVPAISAPSNIPSWLIAAGALGLIAFVLKGK